MIFLKKILSGHIDCSALFSIISIHLSRRDTRCNNIFHVNTVQSKYGYFDSLHRILNCVNGLGNCFDFFPRKYIVTKTWLNGRRLDIFLSVLFSCFCVYIILFSFFMYV